MKKQRLTYSQKIGLILACIGLLVVFVAAIIEKQASVFDIVTLCLIVIGPIFYNAYKGMNQGAMYAIGLLLGAIWVGTIVGMSFLSDNNPLIKKIVLWPIV